MNDSAVDTKVGSTNQDTKSDSKYKASKTDSHSAKSGSTSPNVSKGGIKIPSTKNQGGGTGTGAAPRFNAPGKNNNKDLANPQKGDDIKSKLSSIRNALPKNNALSKAKAIKNEMDKKNLGNDGVEDETKATSGSSSKTSKADEGASAKISIKSPIVKVGLAFVVFLLFLPILLIMIIVSSTEVAYGKYNDVDNLYRINSTNTSSSSNNNNSSSSSGSSEVSTGGIQAKFYAPLQKNATMYGADSKNSYFNHDIRASIGEKVYSPADGTATFKTVTKNGKIASYGNVVVVTTSDGYEFRLAHLSKMENITLLYGGDSNYGASCSNANCQTHVYETRTVKKGELVGEVGESGNAKGSHLHFEVWENGTRKAPESYVGY